MAWTSPKTWAVGDILTAADMNTYVRDNTAFLHDPPTVRVKRATDQNITNDTDTKVNWDSEDFDSDAFHDNSTNNTRLTVPSGLAGQYAIWGCVRWGTGNTGYRRAGVLLNAGVDPIVRSEFEAEQQPSHVLYTEYRLVAADYIEVQVRQTNTNTIVVEDVTSHFGMTLRGH